MSENNDGGLHDRDAGNTGGGVNSGSGGGGGGSNRTQNFSSAYGSTPGNKNKAGQSTPYGTVPFNVPRKDQTLQDRMYGSLGSGMVGTSFGGDNGTGANQSHPVVQPSTVWNPILKKYVPKPTPKPHIDPVTGKMVYPQPTPIRPQDYGFVNPGVPPHQPASNPPYNPNWQNIVDPTLPTHYPTQGIYSPSYGGGLAGTGGVSPVESGNSLGPSIEGNYGDLGGIMGSDGSGPYHDPRGGSQSGGPPNQAGRQFGGPVAPGGQYTVGENGPETLQMGPGGGGQVIPHNPADRLGGMNPQMMQQWFQMMRQRAQQPRPQMPPQQMPQRPPTQPPWQMPPTGQMGPPPRPPQQQPPMQGGFGLSQLGQPGVLGRLRQNQGMG